MLWRHFCLVFIFSIPSAFSLTCYICGDTNLDEYGECSTQFQYDCGTYAARFSSDERIYCRTTRHRAKNNTFTIMKECISEQDHYRTFPEKGYRLDDECDLVDVKGEEVAYCLCRKDFCNRQQVAEQFMNFQEKHPELFGDLDDSKPPAPPKTTFRVGEVPLKIQPLPMVPSLKHPPSSSNPSSFAAPILSPPAIVPVNDLRTQTQPKSSEVVEIRRSQLPSRASGIETEISATPNRPISNSKESELPLMNLPRTSISEGTFVGSGPIINPVPPVSPKREELNQGTRERETQENIMMRCVQCGDGNLHSDTEECKRQVEVQCSSERSMCFTRQISLGNGMFGMEKMCVLPEQLVNEFGEGAREEGCGSSNAGRVQYCACSSPSCNQLSLIQQREIFNSISPPQSSRKLSELAAPELPVPSPPAFTSPPHLPPPTTPPPTTTTPKPIIPTIVNRNRPELAGFKCIACAEADMSDPTADCTSMTEQDCEASAMYCVTKQTQISTSSFAMEKKCMSERDAMIFLPGEKFEEGCATSDGGLVNFCICSGELCNRLSLLQQAQMTGVRDSLEEQRRLEEEIKKQQTLSNSIQTNRIPNQENVGIVGNGNHHFVKNGERTKLPPVFLDEDEQLPEIAKDVRTEEEIIRERQNEWARGGMNSSRSSYCLVQFSIISIIFQTFLTYYL